MAKIVCLLVIVAVLVNSGWSLKCYKCNSNKAEDCFKSANLTSLECPAADDSVPVCYYRFGLDDKKQSNYTSNCGLIKKDQKIVADNLPQCKSGSLIKDVKECKVCQADLCNNSAHTLGISFITFLCLPVMYFLTKL